MPDAKCFDVGELRFGRLAGCGDPVVEPPPVVDRFRVGHQAPSRPRRGIKDWMSEKI